MSGGALLVWLAMMGVSVYVIAYRKREHSRYATRLFIVGGGAVVPTVVLGILLAFGLRQMPDLLAPGSEDGPRIMVSGEQWWWRVRYELPDGTHFELANELRLPVHHRAPLSLHSPDVIHSFWVPALAGKIDMIPGRDNRMALEPTRTGVYRGACAEYCGVAHAKMAFHVVVVSQAEFDAWARAQTKPARQPVSTEGKRGAELFTRLGCGACHAVRGTDADGVVGPDLTHVGSRHSLGAGILDNDVQGFEKWLSRTHEVKPGVLMPTFDMVPKTDVHALASYLEELQ